MKRLAPEREEQIVEWTRQGLTAKVIAERLGITERTVVRARARLGISQTVAAPMTAGELDRARQMVADGCSCADIGRTLGRADMTIARHFPEAVWTPKQVAEASAFGRRMNEIGR